MKSRLEKLNSFWATSLERWAIPDSFTKAKGLEPFALDPLLFYPDFSRAQTPTVREVREALERLDPSDRSLLDVGAGAGGISLLLNQTFSHLTALDASQEMLAHLKIAADTLQIPHQKLTTLTSKWPTSQPISAAVVVCANVLYNISSPVEFISALIDSSTAQVVIEVTAMHPHFSAREIWTKFHHYERPIDPNYEIIVEIVRALGFEPKIDRWERPRGDFRDPTELSRIAARACVTKDHYEELSHFLSLNPPAPTAVISISFKSHRS